MNWVAHIFLSQENFQAQMGNILADVISPQELRSFHPQIYRGVECHYSIDRFTDTHALVRHSKTYFSENYRHYAAVLVDIFYDHFLAVNWAQFCSTPYLQYVEEFHQKLVKQQEKLSPNAESFIDYLLSSNRLATYGTLEGVQLALERISKRPKFSGRIDIVKSMNELQVHYEELNQDFLNFFPQLQNHTHNWLNQHH